MAKHSARGVFRAMSMTIWIVLAVALFVVLAYFVVMRVFFQRSREADKKVDYSKIRPWKDDED